MILHLCILVQIAVQKQSVEIAKTGLFEKLLILQTKFGCQIFTNDSTELPEYTGG